jgi:hypothetical protein
VEGCGLFKNLLPVMLIVILGKIEATGGYYTPLSTLHTPLIGRIWLWAVVDEDPIGNNAVGDGVHASRNKEMKMAQSVMVPDSVGRSTFPERYLPP